MRRYDKMSSIWEGSNEVKAQLVGWFRGNKGYGQSMRALSPSAVLDLRQAV